MPGGAGATSGGRGRAGRGPAVLAAVVVLALAAGCASAPAPRDRGPAPDARFQPALDALAAAIAADDDEVARRMAERIRALGPDAGTLELLRGLERILEGRALVGALSLALEVEEDAGEPRLCRVWLVARSAIDAPVRLELAPPSLVHTSSAVAVGAPEEGFELLEPRSVDRLPLDDLAVLEIPPAGEELRLELTEVSVSTGWALARRDRWRLETRSGSVVHGGESYPAAKPPVAPCERVVLAPYLPAQRLEPAVLADYVRGETVAVPPLLERAVRIEPERWPEALDLLAELSPELPDERLAEISPALRWLARSSRLGADPVAWRHWLAQRRGAGPRSTIPGLDLPLPADGGATASVLR